MAISEPIDTVAGTRLSDLLESRLSAGLADRVGLQRCADRRALLAAARALTAAFFGAFGEVRCRLADTGRWAEAVSEALLSDLQTADPHGFDTWLAGFARAN